MSFKWRDAAWRRSHKSETFRRKKKEHQKEKAPRPLTKVERVFFAIRTGVTYNEYMAKKLPPEVRAYFVRMGRKGGKLGGQSGPQS
jgi:hypothetical protein